MRRMRRVETSIGLRRLLLAIAWVGVASCLLAVPAFATPANFDPVFGFDSSTLGGASMFSYAGPLLDAGDPSVGPGLDVELENSTNVCILASGSSTCQATTAGITSSYSVIASVKVRVVDTTALPGEFTLFLSGLAPEYATSDVVVELDPSAPSAFDFSAISGFEFDSSQGNGGFTQTLAVQDDTFTSMGATYYYVGWTVQDGDTVTFRYDVAVDPDGRAAPGLFANAIPVVIPEPGVLVMMGLGLGGLSAAGRRRA